MQLMVLEEQICRARQFMRLGIISGYLRKMLLKPAFVFKGLERQDLLLAV